MPVDQGQGRAVKHQSTGVKYPAVDCTGHSRGVVTSQTDGRPSIKASYRRDDKNSISMSFAQHGHTTASTCKTTNKPSATTASVTRTTSLSLWKSGNSGRMPNYAAPTVSSQTRSVIHATSSSHREIQRRQHTSPVTSPRVHICPRFHVQPEVLTPPRWSLNRSRSVDPRTSSRTARPSADNVGNKNKNKKTSDDSSLVVPSPDGGRHRSRSADNRCRSAALSASNVDNRCRSIERLTSKSVAKEATGRGGSARSDTDGGSRTTTIQRTNSSSFSRGPVSGKQAKDSERQNGNQRRAQSVTRQTTVTLAATRATTTPATATATRNNHRTESSDRGNRNQTEVSEEYRVKLLENRRLARQQQQQQQQQPIASAPTSDVTEMKMNSSNVDEATVAASSEVITRQVNPTNSQHECDEPMTELDSECRQGQQLHRPKNTSLQQEQQLNEHEHLDDERLQSSPEQQTTRDEEQIHADDCDEERCREDEQERHKSEEAEVAQQEQKHLAEEVRQEKERLEKVRQEQEQERLERANRDEEERLERKKKLALIMQRVKSVDGPASPKSPNDGTSSADNQLSVFQQQQQQQQPSDVRIVGNSAPANNVF